MEVGGCQPPEAKKRRSQERSLRKLPGEVGRKPGEHGEEKAGREETCSLCSAQSPPLLGHPALPEMFSEN